MYDQEVESCDRVDEETDGVCHNCIYAVGFDIVFEKHTDQQRGIAVCL